MGMSGVGKTTLSRKLPTEKWFHYSGDYRIASHYLNDEIGDCLKIEAMKSPLIAALLKSDSVYIGSNLSIDNLAPVSAYIGKLGKADLGGLDLSTFLTRQRKHYQAEIAACYDIGYFKSRAAQLYGYEYFLHDAGGSICELDDEAVIAYMAKETEFVYLHADDDLSAAITERALQYPKPLYYNEAFLMQQLKDYCELEADAPLSEIARCTATIEPNAFIQFVIPKLMAHRRARYLTIAECYGRVIEAKVAYQIRDEADFLALLEH